MSKNYQKVAERLNVFLADTEGESRDELARELSAAGVDVDGFVRDIKSIVAQSPPAPAARSSRLARFANKTRAEIVKLLEEMQAGSSEELPEPVLAHLEGRDLEQLSDEQLQELLVRLDETPGEEPKR